MPTIQDFINKSISEKREKQKVDNRFDFVRVFTAKAGVSGTEAIALPADGHFESLGYNIIYTKNSTDSGAVNKCFVKLMFRSQQNNAAQSSDLIPVQLIATPGLADTARYGYREFNWFYTANDTLLIDYDNQGDGSGTMADETISICFTGHLYKIFEAK